ncbi:MAG: MlaD family protein [Pseudomonas sp.]|uniref:PqiB family protein n=1 Tax=Pseudomonas sp. TaxID=306 RepID=UPI0023A68F7F|nr:MlaD family protein [Pseudomonas sp.]MDE1198471.1 MlaD family protein [Pseudomonas sp.]
MQDDNVETAPVKSRRWNVSLVWIVPVVAILVGASLVVRNWMQEGPTITITFRTGDGLTAHKTQVKYRNVLIGEVTAVDLAKDKKSVAAKVQLSKEAETFARADSTFWVVKPRIGAGGVTGLDTLLSGSFIGADAGQSSEVKDTFKGLESPPPVTYGESGKRFTLYAKDLGSLDIGSPIYYRKIPVGQVISYGLDKSGKGVNIDIFVDAPNDEFVTASTRFWNASGIDVDVGANGLKVNTESLSSMLIGGLAFGAPETASETAVASSGTQFELFADSQAALAPPNGKSQTIVMRFDQAMRGLSVGAPVEFMGVDFGRVTSVQLDFDPVKRSFPVMVEAVIYPERMGPAHTKMISALGHQPEDQRAVGELIGTFVKHGLRAQARSGNLLTGQLYVSLDFYPNAKDVAFDPTQYPLMVPTTPGSLEKVQEQFQQIVDKFSKLPVDKIANNLDASLNALHKSINQFNDKTLPNIDNTLTKMTATVQIANQALSEDSPQREQLKESLDEIQRVSRSLRDLSDYLGRHPESLIRGRPKSKEATSLEP